MPDNKILTYKTLLQAASTLNHVYKGREKEEPQKNKVETNKDDSYHKRLNVAHYAFLHKANIMATTKTAKKEIEDANFAVAEVVFIIQTTKKKLAISFPISTGEDTYNCGKLSKLAFKNFCQTAQNNSKQILEKQNLKLSSQGGYMDYIKAASKYYPQKAYHSEKFFFYYLKNGGLKKIVDLFPTKSITPETIVSIDAMEIRMHSTRDMCPTCESIAISEKTSMITQLNMLLTNKKYPKLPKNFKCNFFMSYHKPEQTGKHQKDLVGIRSQSVPNPRFPLLVIKSKEKIIKKQEFFGTKLLLNAHKYTYFTSGGSSTTFQSTTTNGAIKAKQMAEEVTYRIEKYAAIEIQRIFKGFLVRKTLKPR